MDTDHLAPEVKIVGWGGYLKRGCQGFQKAPPLSERIHQFYERGGDDECWPWTRATNDRGYGFIWDGEQKRTRQATHVMLELVGVVVPKGFLACHKCDNPPCVNPKHLFVGTSLDNVRDAIAKGRAATNPVFRGENHASCRLTRSDLGRIFEMSRARMSHAEIAPYFGYSDSGIWHILTRGVYARAT